MRTVLTPEGLFVYDRTSGLCAFTPDVRSHMWLRSLYAQIALTSKCNLSCWYCYSLSSPQSSAEWPIESLKQLIEFLDSWSILGVAFGGGEPFTYPHLPEIAEWTWNNTGLDVSITTNGTVASEEQIKRLEGYVGEVRVSIGSPKSCSILRKFLGRRFELGVNLLLFRGNTPVLEEIIGRSIKLGVRDFLVNSFLAVGRGVKHKELEPERKDFIQLSRVIDKFREKATFKVSGRIAAKLKAYTGLRFIPFENEERGRIIAITADRKVKPSSLCEESYPFRRPEEIPVIYREKIVGRKRIA
jgi:MoaA/NifB/PqqE/SkfB family radical SAM enzyme